MNPHILIAALLLSATSFAQTKKPKRPYKYADEFLNSRMFIKVNPFAALDPKSPTAMFGLEYRFNKKTAIEVSVGLPLRIGPLRTTDTVHNDFFKVKTEMKFFPESRFMFLGWEAFYAKKDTWVKNGIFRRDDEYYSFKEGRLNRTAWGLAFKVGFAAPVSQRFYFDCFGGVGIRFQNVKANTIGIESAKDQWWFTFHENNAGSSVGPHYTCGIKLGYKLF